MHHPAQWRYQSRNFEEEQLEERALLVKRHEHIPVRCSKHLIEQGKKMEDEIKSSMNMKKHSPFLPPLHSLLEKWMRCAQNATEEGLNT